MSILQNIGGFILSHLPHIFTGGGLSIGGGYVAKNKLGSLKDQACEIRDKVRVTHDTTIRMSSDITTIREESVKQTALLGALVQTVSETNGYVKAVVGMNLTKR